MTARKRAGNPTLRGRQPQRLGHSDRTSSTALPSILPSARASRASLTWSQGQGGQVVAGATGLGVGEETADDRVLVPEEIGQDEPCGLGISGADKHYGGPGGGLADRGSQGAA